MQSHQKDSNQLLHYYTKKASAQPVRILVKDLVAYAVVRLNIFRTTALTQNVCPKVLFTGLKVNYKKERELAFGDYCEVYDGMDNTSRSRSIPCIALFPCNNSTGSWEFLNLQTKQRVRRSNWKLMATTELSRTRGRTAERGRTC